MHPPNPAILRRGAKDQAMNLHTPERSADETQAQYRQRQQASRRVAAAMPWTVTGPSGKVHRKPRGDSGQRPKFAKGRKRKQHVHPLRDEIGAYTLVGRNPLNHPDEPPRRKWLAGISAQLGY
jgi:hypothetical protein